MMKLPFVLAVSFFLAPSLASANSSWVECFGFSASSHDFQFSYGRPSGDEPLQAGGEQMELVKYDVHCISNGCDRYEHVLEVKGAAKSGKVIIRREKLLQHDEFSRGTTDVYSVNITTKLGNSKETLPGLCRAYNHQ